MSTSSNRKCILWKCTCTHKWILSTSTNVVIINFHKDLPLPRGFSNISRTNIATQSQPHKSAIILSTLCYHYHTRTLQHKSPIILSTLGYHYHTRAIPHKSPINNTFNTWLPLSHKNYTTQITNSIFNIVLPLWHKNSTQKTNKFLIKGSGISRKDHDK